MSDASGGGTGETLGVVKALIDNRNAYRHNVFVLIGVDPDAGHEAFDEACRRLRRQLETGQAPVVHGRTIDESDLAAAERLKANEKLYFDERLWTHTVHGLERAAVESALQAIDAVEFPSPESLDPFPIMNAAFLVDLVPEHDDVDTATDAGPDLEALASALLPDPADECGF